MTAVVVVVVATSDWDATNAAIGAHNWH